MSLVQLLRSRMGEYVYHARGIGGPIQKGVKGWVIVPLSADIRLSYRDARLAKCPCAGSWSARARIEGPRAEEERPM